MDTKDFFACLSEFILDPKTFYKFRHYQPKALVDTIKIVMHNKRMKFGDIIPCQLTGMAMGMLPIIHLADLYIDIHKEKEIIPSLHYSVL